MSDNYDKEFYTKFRKFVKFTMNSIYSIEANGLENIPQNERVILAGNHLNILDSWLLLTLIDDNLRFVVDNKLYRYKLWEYFFKKIGTIGINPDKTDINAVKNIIQIAKTDNVVIFPEGKTHKIISSVPFKPGVAKIAKITSSNLIPFGINGSYIPYSNIKINFGEPIDLNKISKSEYDKELERQVRILEKK